MVNQLFLGDIASNISFRCQNTFTKYADLKECTAWNMGQKVGISSRIGFVGIFRTMS